jgi:AhpD family alkylhydroperoxidase
VVDAARAAVMLRCTVGADEPLDAIVFLEVVRGLIVKLTDFWPERYDPPPGREHLTERFWTPAAPPTLMRMQTNASPDEPQRLAMHKVVPDLYKAHLALDSAVARAGIDPLLHELIKIRASQLNGCAYCLDMHTQDARALGESEQRLHLLAAWREAPLYSARERAALALTEAVTLIAGDHVPDDVWDAAAATFEPAEVGALIMAIVAINGWNRIAIAGGARAGTYRSKLSPPTSNAAG